MVEIPPGEDLGEDRGASASGPGSREPSPSSAVSAASGFDHSRDETQLLVNDADKALSWRELDDATLGKFARYFIITAGRAEQERADRDEWPMTPLRAMHGAITLCRMAQDVNAQTATWQLDGVYDASGRLGDWKITAERLSDLAHHRRKR